MRIFQNSPPNPTISRFNNRIQMTTYAFIQIDRKKEMSKDDADRSHINKMIS